MAGKTELSQVAILALSNIERAPVPRQSLNPGLARRLERDHLVSEIRLPSPYKTVKGEIVHLRITDAGRRELRSRGLLPNGRFAFTKHEREKIAGRCSGPVEGVPAPGEVGLDYRATCPRCGKRVAVTAGGRYALHKPLERSP